MMHKKLIKGFEMNRNRLERANRLVGSLDGQIRTYLEKNAEVIARTDIAKHPYTVGEAHGSINAIVEMLVWSKDIQRNQAQLLKDYYDELALAMRIAQQLIRTEDTAERMVL